MLVDAAAAEAAGIADEDEPLGFSLLLNPGNDFLEFWGVVVLLVITDVAVTVGDKDESSGSFTLGNRCIVVLQAWRGDDLPPCGKVVLPVVADAATFGTTAISDKPDPSSPVL